MSDYSRQYDFSVKDALTTGDPAKLIKGSEVDAEFDALVTAVATKIDEPASPSTGEVLEWSGSAWTASNRSTAARFGGLAPANNLYVRNGASPLSQVRVTADELMVFNSSNASILLSTVDETADITVSGVGGLDTGAEASSWYHIYIIYNGSSVDAILSVSASAPTLPGGYTHYAYVGAILNSGTDFIAIQQHGALVNRAQVAVVSGGSGTSPTAVALTSLIPTTASSGIYNLGSYDTGGAVSASLLSPTSAASPRVIVDNSGSTAKASSMVEVPRVENNVYYFVGSTNNRVDALCMGWRF